MKNSFRTNTQYQDFKSHDPYASQMKFPHKKIRHSKIKSNLLPIIYKVTQIDDFFHLEFLHEDIESRIEKTELNYTIVPFEDKALVKLKCADYGSAHETAKIMIGIINQANKGDK